MLLVTPVTFPDKKNQNVAGENSADVLEQITNIRGLDVEYGLALVRGDQSKYIQILTLFANVHFPDLARIPALLSQKDIAEVKRLVHTMKGSAAMIGATGVADAATRLHTAIVQAAAHTDIEFVGTELCEELELLIEGIRNASIAH